MRKLLVISLFAITLFSCKKDVAGTCDQLEQGLIDNNATQVASAISAVIAGMDNKDYTEPNISLLVQNINSQCSVDAKVFCFDCIKTLPSMTEIELSVNSAGIIYSSIIDISYTSSNKMVFRAVHE